MTIVYNPNFEEKLISIIDYIALDKPKASINFASELEKQILNIPYFPYKHRKSIYFDDENIRDMIFKSYTINYEIDLKNNRIIVFDIFNKNKPPLS